ncbi:MAG: cupin domain-containing protein [Betaproteobacteria bacterium]|nr:cupin domain-containing protein [Betaproteobacteria bacterium]
MTPEQFSEQLAGEGFAQIVTVERPAGELTEHAHPFEAKALILEGEITLEIAGRVAVYRAGQVFHLPAETPHRESYGPAGVRYLVGRK